LIEAAESRERKSLICKTSVGTRASRGRISRWKVKELNLT